MTEETQVLNEQEAAIPQAAPAQQQPMLPQSEVNRIVKQEKEAALKKGYDRAMAELQAQQQSQPAAQQPMNQMNQPPSGQNVQDWRQMMSEELDRREQQARAERERAEQEAYTKQVLNSIHNKALQAKQEIPDFDEVTSQVDFGQLPDILGLADTVDNGGHVLYELAKNPSKIGALRGLSGSPALQVREIKRLSDSLKQNVQAQNTRLPGEPLSNLQPSKAGVSSGEPSLKDLKRRYTVQLFRNFKK